MRSPNVNWSDIEAASTLSRELIRREPGPVPASAATAGYARFSPRPDVHPAVTAAPTPVPASRPSLGPLELDSWEMFLAWSLELTRARAGFVVDSQGFVIASRGNLPADGFAGIGAELCYAMDQLCKIDSHAGPLRLLELQFESSRLVGVRADADEMGTVLIGFQGSRSLTDEVRETLVRQLLHSVPRLR